MNFAVVEALVERAAEILLTEPSAVLSRSRKYNHCMARDACWHVLREESWTLEEIGRAFNRDHSSIHHGEAKSRLLVNVDSEHAYLVKELRRVVQTWRGQGFATVEDRTRAQVWALDQEIAAATVLRDELVGRISRAQRLRSELAAVLADFPSDVITRGAGRQLQEVAS